MTLPSARLPLVGSDPSISSRLFETAGEWVVAGRDPAWSPAQQAELDAWLAADPAHRDAFDRLSGTWAQLAELPRPDLASDASRAAGRHRHPLRLLLRHLRAPRRLLPWPGRGRPFPWLAPALGLAALVVAGFFAWPLRYLAPGLSLDLATGHQETRVVDLFDGSRINLNVGSRLDIAYRRDARHVSLEAGEAFFEIAADPGRPFVVDLGPSRITVTGTAFNVKVSATTAEIQVLEGRVRVETPGRPGAQGGQGGQASQGGQGGQGGQAGQAGQAGQGGSPGVELLALQGLVIDRASGEPRPLQLVADNVAAWRSGRLVFRSALLGDVAAELARYLGQPVTVADPALAGLVVSGFTATATPAAFLEALPDLLPVGVSHEAGGYRIVRR